MTFLKHFAFLNVLAILLFWMATSELPSRLYVTVETDAGVSLCSDSGRGCTFAGTGRQTNHLWLPVGADTARIYLSRHAGAATIKPVGARLWTRLVLETKWDSDAIEPDGTGGMVLDAKRARIGLSKIGIVAVVGGEVGLMILAWVFVLLAKGLGNGDAGRGPRLREVLVVAVCLAAFCAIIVPMQTFLSNRAELNLNGWAVLGDCAVRALGIAIVVFVLLFVSTRFAKSLYLIAASAFLLYAYLETGVLSIGQPSFTGDMGYFKNVARMAWDALALIGCFLVLYMSARGARALRVCEWASLAVLVLGTLSLLDVKKGEPAITNPSDIACEFKSKDQVVREAVYSGKKNVLVYVLDCFPTPLLLDLFNEAPAFANGLTGFTCFTNHVGIYRDTVTAVAGMATGKLLDDVNKMPDYMRSVFSAESFVADYLKNGASVFVNPGSYEVGISVGGQCANARQEEVSASATRQRMKGQQSWNLFEIARFRLAPFALKWTDYILTVAGWNSIGGAGVNDELKCYGILAKAPVREDVQSVLQIWHTIGAHPPFSVNREGIDDGVTREGYDAKFEKGWYAWRQLDNLLKHLKSTGIYDSSFIVITADHGDGLARDKNGRPAERKLSSRIAPILLVKPIGATGVLRYSNRTTGHLRLHDLLARARTEVLSTSDVEEVRHSEDRCYSLVEAKGFRRYHVAPDWNFREEFVASSGGDVLKQTIQLGHRYSLLGENSGDRPPVQFENCYYHEATGPIYDSFVGVGQTRGGMTFRVPEPNSDYLVEIELASTAGLRVVDAQTGVSVESNGKRAVISLTAKSTADKLVTLSFSGTDQIGLYNLEVERHQP